MNYTECPEKKTVELKVNGKVTENDFDLISSRLEAFIKHHGTIKLIEIIDHFQGMEAGMILKGIRFDIKNLKHISHVAVVSDIGWISPISKAAGAFVSTKLRTFSMDQLEEARKWLDAPVD